MVSHSRVQRLVLPQKKAHDVHSVLPASGGEFELFRPRRMSAGFPHLIAATSGACGHALRDTGPHTDSGDAEMADDLSNRGPQDRSRVNVNETHELRYWTKELGVTEAQLRAAVAAAGTSAQAVRNYLGK